MFIHPFLFLIGDMIYQYFPYIGSIYFLTALLILTVALFSLYQQKYLFIIMGYLYVGIYVNDELLNTLDKKYESTHILVHGFISSVPVFKNEFVSYEFDITKINSIDLQRLLKVKISDQNLRNPHVGDEIEQLIKLKKIHSSQSYLVNDYEAWAFQHKIKASGHIVPNQAWKLIQSHPYRYPIQSFREFLMNRVNALKSSADFSPWILAVGLGFKGNIPDSDWEMLSKTGTNHLIAVAGLHLMMTLVFTQFILSIFLKRVKFNYIHFPGKTIHLYISNAVMLTYALISGFAIPAQRASIMRVAFSLFVVIKYSISKLEIYSLTLFLLIIVNPLIILTDSFWLSFGTVFFILYSQLGRLRNDSSLSLIRLQALITISISTLTLYYYHYFSPMSFIANAIAVPFLEWIILPLTICSFLTLFISSYLANSLFLLSSSCINTLRLVLRYISSLDWIGYHGIISSSHVLFLSILTILLILLPKGIKGKGLGLILILPIFVKGDNLSPYSLMMSVLDVGQGLAIVVKTEKHTLVYDTGGAYYPYYDMGKSVLLPYLEYYNTAMVDAVVLSHPDRDHIGGLKSLVRKYPIKLIYTNDQNHQNHFLPSLPLDKSIKHLACVDERWIWDGIQFHLFSIANPTSLHVKNDSSCVLKVSTPRHSFLIPGDIESKAEIKLLDQHANELPSDVIVAPHHGSSTSLYLPFLKLVNPDYVIYSAGYLNQYHLPSLQTVRLYSQLGVKEFNTATDGTIDIKVSADINSAIDISTYRSQFWRYWFS